MRDAKGKFCKGRPFKVGDRVVHPVYGIGTVGSPKEHWHYSVAFDNSGPVIIRGYFYGYHSLEGFTHAPQVPESPLTTDIRERDEAREERDARTEALDRVCRERDAAVRGESVMQGRAEAAELKLADIHSIMRVTALSTNAFDVNSLILKVLDRE